MRLPDLLENTPVQNVRGEPRVTVRGVTSDSRLVRPGFIFVAIPGLHRDGRRFVGDAAKRGAAAVVTEEGGGLPAAPCGVEVANARRAVADLAAAFYGYPSRRLQTVGITGTNGKTTIAYLVREVFREAGRMPGLIGTVEYEFGERRIPAARTTPEAPELQSLLRQMVLAGCRSAVMEVSSHALAQDRARGIDFSAAVFTNLTRDHLDYHKSMEEYFMAKRRLFTGLPEESVAVLNADDAWGRRLLADPDIRAERLSFGFSEDAVVRATNVRVDMDGSTFGVRTPWGAAEIHTHLPGRFNVLNLLAAVAVCCRLDVPFDSTMAVLSSLVSVPGRMEPVPTDGGFQVYVDYAHTDDALRNVLGTLRDMHPARLITVFGCGGDRDRTKRPAMGAVSARWSDITILTSDNPRKEDPVAILDEIRSGVPDGADCRVIADRREAIASALELAAPGDIVLVAGKGHETYQEFSDKTVMFDDRHVVRSILGT